MDRLGILVEGILASPITWGFVTLVAVAFALSGKLNMTAATAFLWLAVATAMFGIYRAEVIVKLDVVLRMLILACCGFGLAAAAVAGQRWMKSEPKPAEPAVGMQRTNLVIRAYVQPHEPYPAGTLLAGIVWRQEYVDVRLDLENGEAPIQNLNLLVQLDTSIAGIGQISQLPGFNAFPADSLPPTWLVGRDSGGKPMSIPVTPTPGMANFAPIYRVQCPSMFPNTTMHLALASVALNSVTPTGGMPATLFASRKAPKTIHIKGEYGTSDGSSHPIEFSYNFPAEEN